MIVQSNFAGWVIIKRDRNYAKERVTPLVQTWDMGKKTVSVLAIPNNGVSYFFGEKELLARQVVPSTLICAAMKG